jgi:hypothetical protein
VKRQTARVIADRTSNILLRANTLQATRASLLVSAILQDIAVQASFGGLDPGLEPVRRNFVA